MCGVLPLKAQQLLRVRAGDRHSLVNCRTTIREVPYLEQTDSCVHVCPSTPCDAFRGMQVGNETMNHI